MAKQKKRMITKEAKKKADALNKVWADREYLTGRREVWAKYKIRTDINTLAGYCGVSRQAIWNAINNGVGSIELLKNIDNYFKPREDADTKKD